MTQRSSTRAAVALVVVAALVSLGMTAFGVARASEHELVTSRVCDDAYYFAQWARNVARGAGPSFDGREFTDGVRPIWALALVPIYALVDDPSPALRAACLLGALLHVASLALLARLLSRWLEPLACAAAAAVGMLAPSFVAQGSGAMDWAMNAFLQVALLVAFERVWSASRPARTALAGVGVLLALNLLERPETSVLALCLALLWGWTRRAELGWIAAGAAVVIAPFALASIALFGKLGSVAGELKLALSLLTLDAHAFAHALALVGGRGATELARDVATAVVPIERVAPSGPDPMWTALAAGACAVAAVLLLRAAGATNSTHATHATHAREERRREAARRVAIVGVLAFGALHALLIAVCLHRYLGYGRWYLAPQDLALCTLIALALHALARRFGASIAVAIGLTLVVLATVSFTRDSAAKVSLARGAVDASDARSGTSEPSVLQVAAWVDANLPTGTRIGSHNAGALAYYSRHAVTNLDGLMNTHAFLHACVLETDANVRNLNIVRYLVSSDIRYLVDPWDPAHGDRVPSRLLGPSLGKFFQLVWSMHMPDGSERGVDYQIYAFDIGAARAALASYGLAATDAADARALDAAHAR